MNTVGILADVALGRYFYERLPQAQRQELQLLPTGAADFLFLPSGLGAETPLPTCRILLLPSTMGSLVYHCTAPCVISYGSSAKDSLTFSSNDDGQISLSIQRELLTVQGSILDQQEIILSPKEGDDRLSLLAMAAFLLVCGVPPEELSNAL